MDTERHEWHSRQFSKADWCWLYDSILNTSHFEKQNYHACGCILIYSNFRLLAQDTDPECRLLAQDTDPECLGFAIRFPVHPKWSPMISDMKGVFPTCPSVQLAPNLATDFSRQTSGTKYWAVGHPPYRSNHQVYIEPTNGKRFITSRKVTSRNAGSWIESARIG